MQLTDVTVKIVKNRPYLRGSASIVIDNAIKIRKLSIIQGRNNELFVSWPSEKLKNGTYLGVAYPINNDVRLEISEKILGEYNEIMRENGTEPIEFKNE